MFFFSRLRTQIIIKEYRDFENQQISCDCNVKSRNHFQNDIESVTDIILSRLRDLRHYLRCINSSLFCDDIPRVVGIFS